MTNIQPPPIHAPNYFTQQLEDQYQSGWIDGYEYADNTNGLHIVAITLIGFTIGVFIGLLFG